MSQPAFASGIIFRSVCELTAFISTATGDVGATGSCIKVRSPPRSLGRGRVWTPCPPARRTA